MTVSGILLQYKNAVKSSSIVKLGKVCLLCLAKLFFFRILTGRVLDQVVLTPHVVYDDVGRKSIQLVVELVTRRHNRSGLTVILESYDSVEGYKLRKLVGRQFVSFVDVPKREQRFVVAFPPGAVKSCGRAYALTVTKSDDVATPLLEVFFK